MQIQGYRLIKIYDIEFAAKNTNGFHQHKTITYWNYSEVLNIDFFLVEYIKIIFF